MSAITWLKYTILKFEDLKSMRIYIRDSFKSDEYKDFSYQGWVDDKVLSSYFFNELCHGQMIQFGLKKLKKEFPIKNCFIIIKTQDQLKKLLNIKNQYKRNLKDNIHQKGLENKWFARIPINGEIYYLNAENYDDLLEKKRYFLKNNNINYYE